MAWQTAPGLLVIVGGFSAVGALYAGVDGLRNWIYKKVSAEAPEERASTCMFLRLAS